MPIIPDADMMGWRASPIATKLKKDGSSGLDLLLAGYQYNRGIFYSLGQYGDYWSASLYGSNAWYRRVEAGYSNVYPDRLSRVFRFSVQLVKDKDDSLALWAG